MKCIPSTLSGRLVAAPSTVIEIDEVFEERMTSGGVSASSWRTGSLRLGVLDDRLDDVVGFGERVDRRRRCCSRPSAASRSAGVSLPFSTNFARLFSIVARARSSTGCRDVHEPYLEARLREHLGDPVAHRACADYPTFLISVIGTISHECMAKGHEE